jgi:hypothetical protein
LPASGVDGALASVISLGTGNAYGIVVYDGTEWLLHEGWFNTVADMEAFAEPITIGALASVEETADNNENGVRYQYEGTWTRVAALSTGYVWALSSPQDFSPLGLKEGDYGSYTPTGGKPVTLRYKAAVSRTAGAGGGTTPMWVPIEAYGGTNLQLDSWFVGTENNTTLATQGFTVAQTAPGTVSSVGGYIRLDAPAVSSGFSVSQLTSPTITGAKKFALMCEMRGSFSNFFGAGGLYQLATEASTQWSWANISAVTVNMRQSYWTTTWVDASSTFTIRGGTGLPLPTVAPWHVLAVCPDTASNGAMTTTLVDGSFYSVYRRDSDGATNASNFTLTPVAVGGTASAAARIELRNYYRLVWD